MSDMVKAFVSEQRHRLREPHRGAACSLDKIRSQRTKAASTRQTRPRIQQQLLLGELTSSVLVEAGVDVDLHALIQNFYCDALIGITAPPTRFRLATSQVAERATA